MRLKINWSTDNGLVIAVETTTENRHDSQSMLSLLDKAGIEPNS